MTKPVLSWLGLVRQLNRKMVNDKAFKFLPRCDKAKIDWTIAHPLTTTPHPAIHLENIEKEAFGKYSPLKVSPLLIKASQAYFQKQNIVCNEDNIVVGSSIFNILGNLYKILQVKELEQEVLLPTPTFGQFYKQCVYQNIATHFLETTKQDDWQICPEALNEKLSKNSNIKILLTNFPNNPTGKMMTQRNAQEIAEVLQGYPEVLIICDEIFRDIPLQMKLEPHYSFAAMPELAERTIIINSAGKSRGLAGVRVAFAYLPKEIADLYQEERGMDNIPSGYEQRLVALALEDTPENQEFLVQNIVQYHQNINHLKGQISALNQKLNQHFGEEGMEYIKPYNEPEAGNVYLLDFSGLRGKFVTGGKVLNSGLDVAEFFLEKAEIGVVPGECFFIPEADMVIRVPISTMQQETEIGFEKLAEAMIENLKNPPRVKINVESSTEKSR